MKKTIAILLLWVLAVCTGAQAQLKKASPAQSKAMIARIDRAAASIKTATCTFVQTKTMSFLNDKMVSRGHMYYTSAHDLFRITQEALKNETFAEIVNTAQKNLSPTNKAAEHPNGKNLYILTTNQR